MHPVCALALGRKSQKIAVSFAPAATARLSSISFCPLGESRHREHSCILLCLLCRDPLHRLLHVLASKKVRKSIVLAGSLIAAGNLHCCSVATPGAGADIRVQRENTNSSPFCRPSVDASVPFCRGPNQHPLIVARPPWLQHQSHPLQPLVSGVWMNDSPPLSLPRPE